MTVSPTAQVVAEQMSAAPSKSAAVRPIPQHGLSSKPDGRNHLRSWGNALHKHQMAVLKSLRGEMRGIVRQMAMLTSDMCRPAGGGQAVAARGLRRHRQPEARRCSAAASRLLLHRERETERDRQILGLGLHTTRTDVLFNNSTWTRMNKRRSPPSCPRRHLLLLQRERERGRETDRLADRGNMPDTKEPGHE